MTPPVDMYIGQSYYLKTEGGQTSITVSTSEIDFSKYRSIVALPYFTGMRMDDGDILLINGFLDKPRAIAVGDITGQPISSNSLCGAGKTMSGSESK